MSAQGTSLKQAKANNAINADSHEQRSFVASLAAAGYGGVMRLESTMNNQEITPILSTVLIRDVVAGMERIKRDNSDSAKRDYVRAVFAGIEGLIWFLKLQVTGGHGHGLLNPSEIDALFERSWTVTDRGEIREVSKFLPTPTAIRLLVRTIQRFDPEYKVDFQHLGWQRLNDAIQVRNRLVHPKSVDDLIVGDLDINNCTAGFSWVFAYFVPS